MPVNFKNFSQLHPDGRSLIFSWANRAKELSARSNEEVFEPFIYCWIAFNAWAACATGSDVDRDIIDRLAEDIKLSEEFANLLDEDREFRATAEKFQGYWPIFKVQHLRRHDIQTGGYEDREALLDSLISSSRNLNNWFAPQDKDNLRLTGQGFPLDWENSLRAIYRVRCNLFHGDKSVRIPLDQEIVSSALHVLLPFFTAVLKEQ